MTKKLLQLYGLKWNPFAPDVPTEALLVSPKLEHFGWRLENLVRDGGFALITGDPGTGKSGAMRIVAERLAALRDVVVGVVELPQGAVSDFYRELGYLFGVPLAPRNRWGGFKALREKWQAHIEATLVRPVLLIDEAQEMSPAVLAELRLLVSAKFDSRSLLTVVLAGDGRLLQRFQSDDLLPLASRMRVRLLCETASPQELAEVLRHAQAKAGNLRVLHGMAADLLAEGAQREAKQLDEKLYLEVFAAPTDKPRVPKPTARAARAR